MKLKQLTAIALGSAFCVVSSCNDSKETGNNEQSKKTDTETPAAKPAADPNIVTLTPAEGDNAESVFVVVVAGKGWSVGMQTRSVLLDQKGVKKVKLSGLRATVFVEPGTTLNKETLKKGFEGEGLKFVSAEASIFSKPVAAYSVSLKGTGWTDTAEKVRVALEGFDNVSSAFVNQTAELFLTEDSALDEEAVKKAINDAGAKFVSMKKSDVEL